MSTDPAPTMPSNLLPQIFTSLGRSSRPWSLVRILKSTNAKDIQGELRGTATFRPLRAPSLDQQPDGTADMVYREEGEMPAILGLGSGLRFTKKYIWRMSESGRVSVWFAKVQKADAQDAHEEPDYLFHEFEVAAPASESTETPLVLAPIPPPDATFTTVVTARGNHLCINDMYHTAYAFRIRPDSGEVVSWSSRHVVKGPKKDQDIVNLYRREEE
ncbi:hypothetical protein P170DRAFT_278939 [Aspergillus steynii IBT 23096]|uniref:DUF6314 domain-containing protein n=1 Tax=Aspergillus steynii IBT 23096 TaxID=1392250 RepID=A0A2I2FXI9_9EURO|nr:uncharacterized protein P170DRAFT_278939 [Aspergillus steynii IBT 23096]PLB45296.1 hypothetical protein P170DRAFT_278939 [Aspergillus steynii IBT 23096]